MVDQIESPDTNPYINVQHEFNKEHTMRKKLGAVADYFNETHISEMLKNAEGLITDKTTKSKVKMVNKKRFRLLYLCFYAKEMILRIRKCMP